MIKLSDNINSELTKRTRFVIPVVEIYPRNTVDITSVEAPKDAIALFSNRCFLWETTKGTYEYEAKIKEFPEVQTFIGEELNNAEIVFSNVKRGEGSMSRFVLNNNVKGCWMVIRLVFPDYPDESLVVFWGKCDRPGGISNEELTITATQDLGNFKQEIPFRTYGTMCPLEFARPGGDCLGDQTLAEKSLPYRNAVAAFGTAGCNKLFGTCTSFENDKYYQGQRVVAVSGQYSYITIEEVVKRVLFWTKRKKIQVVKTDNWSSVNQSENSETVPIAFGRCQIQGHPFTWADIGTQVKSMLGFCEGKIAAFTFIRSRTYGINILQAIEHLGEYGGVGTQQLDNLFGGGSGYNSKLAYLEVVTDGSQPTQVDDAPIITAVIKGLELPVPDINGLYNDLEATNNPVHVIRYILTDLRFGRIPVERMDDEVNIETAADCDEIVEDRTNEESLVLPSNEYENYGIGYRRFRSAGRVTARRVRPLADPMFEVTEDPVFEEPEIRWFNPFLPYIVPPHRNVIRQKYTFNGALQEKTSLLDFINERILPTFKGFINYGFNGKIQIKNRRAADNTYLRTYTKVGATTIPVTNVKKWRTNRDGYAVIGVSLETAEVRQISGFKYAPACAGMNISAVSSGGVVATTSPIDAGNDFSPGRGYIDISGDPSAGDFVSVTFNSGVDAFTIDYIADGIEDLATFAIMFKEFLNANIQFSSYLSAYVLPSQPGRIWVQCESGYLTFVKPLEYHHDQVEEVLRVNAVFENCGELTANQSAQFDNIIAGTFKWNDQDSESVNAITAKYTSAVDDFHLANLMPRAAWDTIDLEGELSKDELDLTFVDNYWQAAYLAKSEAIDRIDGNISFKFDTDFNAIRLELGDVVAVRHDSGDGALNYVPVWITAISFDLDQFLVHITAKLYLSAAFDYHVQPIEPLLTTTLNVNANPSTPPDTIGTNGGVSTSSEPNVPRPSHKYYEQFQGLGRYSPDGLDIV